VRGAVEGSNIPQEREEIMAEEVESQVTRQACATKDIRN